MFQNPTAMVLIAAVCSLLAPALRVEAQTGMASGGEAAVAAPSPGAVAAGPDLSGLGSGAGQIVGAAGGWTHDAGVVRLTTGTDKVGVGTTTPAHHLSIVDGPAWTSNFWAGALELSNGSALGWQANSGGNRFGLGQSNGGLYFFHTGSDPGTTGSPAVYDMTIADWGGVGINMSNPPATLTVQNIEDNFFALQVLTTSGSPGLTVYLDGSVGIGKFLGTSTQHVCYSGFGFSNCSSAAEYVPTIDAGAGSAEPGDLVSIAPSVKNPYDDRHAPFGVTRTTRPCDDNLLGLIVDPASSADGKRLNGHYLPLAVYGYFPAKVTVENGAIRRGDPITSSSRPGRGMKATGACRIIGYALEDAETEGTIQVFAHLGEHPGPEVARLKTQVDALQRENAELRRQFQQVLSQVDAIRAETVLAVERLCRRGPPAGPTPLAVSR
jgi:hypothetical protein